MPIPIAALIAMATAGATAYSGYSQSQAQQKANEPYGQFQERKNQLIDDLLASLDGTGKYGHLFRTDEEAFQTSFVDPAKQMFSSQIAPQIQQGTISSGLQRSSNLTDQLSRAGIDLDQMLNQQFMEFQGQGQDRIAGILSSIMGQGAQQPLTAPTTTGSAVAGGAAGFLSSDAFNDYLASFGKKGAQAELTPGTRPGFTS